MAASETSLPGGSINTRSKNLDAARTSGGFETTGLPNTLIWDSLEGLETINFETVIRSSNHKPSQLK